MNAALSIVTDAPKIIALPRPERQVKEARFKIQEFTNRSGSQSWRVTGSKRDGARVRENFADVEGAQCRQIELETEYLRGHADTTIQATKLSAEQVQLCEVAMIKLGDDWARILDAVDHWHRTGAKNLPTDAPKIDDAIDEYLRWLEAGQFRDATKRHWKIRMNIFKNSVSNVRVSEVTPEIIEKFLEGRKISACGKDTDRRAISRFFSWAIERPRRWVTSNPCREVKTTFKKGPPQILTVAECEKLLKAAEKYRRGICAPSIALGLFGGLRPSEAARVQWSAINLKDREIRIEAGQTKTERPRVVEINDTLHAWLTRYKGASFTPTRYAFDAVRKSAGFRIRSKDQTLKVWVDDVLRHTAISHHFRKHESYGKAAEQFGNSEAIIKNDYQARVTTAETEKFYALMPAKKKGGK
jgi:integrase